jgi:hypothetical protein
MPFKRSHAWLYSFEQEANKGKEFIMPITTSGVHNYWTLALGAILKQKASDTRPERAGGVLVIRYHGKPLGVVGQFQILRNILLEWNGGSPNPVVHPAINAELALLADSAKPTQPQPFRSHTLGVRSPRHSIAALLRDLGQEGGAAAITRYHHLYAFLIPLSLLARFRLEAKQQSAQEWRESILNWMFDYSLQVE